MRFLNGRLDENSHLLKRSIERDTAGGDALDEGMVQLELRVDRISSYLGLEPMIPPTEKDAPTTPVAVPQVRKPAKPPAQPTPEVIIPLDQKLYDVNMDLYRKEKYEEAIVGFKNFLRKYPKSKFIRKIKAEKSGYIKSIDNYQIGMAALELGAGRKTKTDKIDPKAGIIFKIKLGDKIKKGEVVAELHAHSMDKINTAKGLVLGAITVSKQKTTKPKLIKKIIE